MKLVVYQGEAKGIYEIGTFRAAMGAWPGAEPVSSLFGLAEPGQMVDAFHVEPQGVTLEYRGPIDGTSQVTVAGFGAESNLAVIDDILTRAQGLYQLANPQNKHARDETAKRILEHIVRESPSFVPTA